MQCDTFLAHKREADDAEQSLREHLMETAACAREHASPWGSEFAYLCGMAHDIGKYSTAFQKRIRGANQRVDHATAGGQLLVEKTGNTALSLFAAYCIMGHHGGLPNGGSRDQDSGSDATLYGRLKRKVEPFGSHQKEIALPEIKAFPLLQQMRDGFDYAFFIRMVFSALVDADWLDTEKFFQTENAPRGGLSSLDMLCGKVMGRASTYLKAERALNALNEKRNRLLQNCLHAAHTPGRLFTLTAPTGSGKTFAGLAFALKHAVETGKKRIIYIAPFNVILEQNTGVFREILGEENVLQHYGDAAYDGDDEIVVQKRNSIENWNFPFITTSNVQFFESLFARTPSKCRKLHNIANSVLLFDEAQMIPVPYLLPCVRAIEALTAQYGCTAVLATATQSSMDGFFEQIKPEEIVESPQELFTALRRTTLRQIEEPLTDIALMEKLLAEEQVLCIVNTRRHAQNLFQSLHARNPEGVFHLSTTMYPAHRMRILQKIHQRLADGQACRVISTNLVEAGVDMDFAAVFREEAGLDNIMQAAGRCNREGRRAADESIVSVFASADVRPPRFIQPNIDAYRQIVRRYVDVTSLEAIQAYFQQLYYNRGMEWLDNKGIVMMLNDAVAAGMSFPFSDVEKAFRLIDDAGQQTIYVLHEREDLAQRAVDGERTRDLFREMGPYSVSLFAQDVHALKELHALMQPDMQDESVLLLPEHHYDAHMGILLEPEGAQAIMI